MESVLEKLRVVLPARIMVALEAPKNTQFKKYLERFIDTVRMVHEEKTLHKGLLQDIKDYVPNYQHMEDIMQDQPQIRNKFNTHLTQYLQAQGKQGLLYMPQRYDEWELRVFDPRDVMMLDIRKPSDPAFDRLTNLSFRRKEGMNGPFKGTPSMKETLKDCQHAGEDIGIKTKRAAGLGRIYEDINLPSLQKWSPEVASATAQEVKTKVLTDSLIKRREGV
jgi:hypothetical protein